MLNRRHVLLAATAFASGGVGPSGKALAQDYSIKPITIIVPAAAGSPGNFPARLASQVLPPRLGQPIVIEYRPGVSSVSEPNTPAQFAECIAANNRKWAEVDRAAHIKVD